MNTLNAIVDRAVMDADFLVRLGRDPIGTAYAEGYAVSLEEIKGVLGLNGASDRDLVVTLQRLLLNGLRDQRPPG
jgi:hypothetical protein